MAILRCLFQDDGPGRANSDVPGDMADDVPEAQETVQVIPGSKLLWRINSRPPNSAQVCILYLPPLSETRPVYCRLVLLYLPSWAHNFSILFLDVANQQSPSTQGAPSHPHSPKGLDSSELHMINAMVLPE